MRIINLESKNCSKEIESYKRYIMENLIKDIKQQFEDEQGYIRYETLNIYKEQLVTKRLKVTFVFTLYMGKSFKETITYSLYSDLDTEFLVFNIGFGKNSKTYKKTELKNIKDFIINDVLQKRVNLNNHI